MLIGSRALQYWIPEYKYCLGKDWDFIGEQTVEVPEGDRIEIHSIDFLNNKDALSFCRYGVCDLQGLTLIKRSHLWRDYQFDKHITQYHKHLLPNSYGITGKEDFLVERIKLTKEAFKQGNPSLKQSNEDFFDDAVDKVYDHDWLHELYAYQNKPMYEKLKKPDHLDQAWCEKDLWLNLTKEDQYKCVAEECYVIATERFLVSKQFDYPYKLAYIKALNKVCTTLTSGWFRDFAIDNYPNIYNLYDENKIQLVKRKLL